MKKALLAVLGISFSILAMAQKDTSAATKPKKIFDLTDRPADHFVIQYGWDSWTNRPDSVRTDGFSRHFNMYFMLDKPFKSNPHMSVAFGVGIGSSNMFFKNTRVDIKSNSARLPFTNLDSTDHFEKYKVVNIYGEIPVELRYYSDPEHPDKSWKGAFGLKVGTLLKTHTKGKNYVTKNGGSIYGTGFIEKEGSKRFFNTTMLAVTGRVGYGFVSIDAGYQFNGVLKEGTGASMNRFSIGLTISGL
jgi:hypothetical protein